LQNEPAEMERPLAAATIANPVAQKNFCLHKL
jgi:hypothetical protein